MSRTDNHPHGSNRWWAQPGAAKWTLLILLTAGLSHGQNAESKPDPSHRYSRDFINTLHKLEQPWRVKLPSRIPGTRQETLIDLQSKREYLVIFDTSEQAYRLSMPEDRQFSRKHPRLDLEPNEQDRPATILSPSLVVHGDFHSASALAFKAKQFDDGLYAAVELGIDKGSGDLTSRSDLLILLEEALKKGESHDNALALLGAAAELGGHPLTLPRDIQTQADAIKGGFLDDPMRAKPLGFYTWSPELSRIFQRDRLLQAPLDEMPEARDALVAALGRNRHLLDAYGTHCKLNAKLTNGFIHEPLADAAKQMAADEPWKRNGLALFPASRSHETDLMRRLFENRPIPDDFQLADEMVRRIRAGEINLKPNADSGWYDHQTYALEPLVIPERMPEAAHLEFDDSYRKELAKLFKALLAMTRESHLKQLEFLGVPMSALRRDELIRINLRPELSQEPLAEYYLRRAQSYRFIGSVLAETFGLSETPGSYDYRGMSRMTPDGPMNLRLKRELKMMESLFYGAYLNTALEIGMTPKPQEGLGIGHAPSLALYLQWKPEEDPDLCRDIRMMVPVFYDLERKKTKVWVVMGVTSRPLTIRYKKQPVIRSVLDEHNQPVDLERIRLSTPALETKVAYPVMEELYVDKVLNREEFRALCDEHRTREAIIDALQQLK